MPVPRGPRCRARSSGSPPVSPLRGAEGGGGGSGTRPRSSDDTTSVQGAPPTRPRVYAHRAVPQGSRDPVPDDGTFTLGEYHRRNDATAMTHTNGSTVETAPVVLPNDKVAERQVRLCANCEQPLKATQARACSQSCARQLGAHRNSTSPAPTSSPGPSSLTALLDALPPK